MSKQQEKRTRRVHTREFKAETVKLVKAGGRGVSELARELGLADSVVRSWGRQADVDAGKGPPGALTTAEKEELSHLRREVKVLRMERMAFQHRRPTAGLVHHSDRGSTYASGDYRKALDAREIECSMSRKGDCWDNAVAESFFASMKREMEDIDAFESWAHATLSTGEYIDGFYNFRRRHSTIGYNRPVEFELIHSVKKAA